MKKKEKKAIKATFWDGLNSFLLQIDFDNNTSLIKQLKNKNEIENEIKKYGLNKEQLEEL